MASDPAERLNKENLRTGFMVLLRYLGRYKREIVTLSGIGIISAAGNGSIPYISGRLFDSIPQTSTVSILGSSVQLFAAMLGLWVIVQAITYLVDWKANVMSEYLSNKIWFDYLAHGFSYLLELPMAFHKKNKIGDIGNQINIAGNSLETIAGRIVIDLAPQLLSIVIALAIAFWIMPSLASLLLAGLAIYVLILAYNIRPLVEYQRLYREHTHAFFADAYDNMGNAIAVKQATSEAHERAKLFEKGEKALPMWIKMTMVWSNLSLYQRFVILATQLAVFAISIWHIRSGGMTIGELIAFNAYAAMIFGPFVTIARNWQTIQNGIVNIQKTEEILTEPTEAYHPTGAVDFELTGGIRMKDVSFKYEEGRSVLQGISFDAKPGDVIALVGESGVGKSTLIDLISGYHFADSGTVEIDGHDIRTVDLTRLRSKIGVVPQEVVLFNDTIGMNIKYGNFVASEEAVHDAARKAHAYDFIERFPERWNQIVGERGVKLSVGQKQRVAIARAILRNPVILVLDEPTSALDASSERIITESLKELMKGKTTFIIAHRLSTVREADKILVFKEGRIVESGKHEELLAKEGGEYRRLYELQIGLRS